MLAIDSELMFVVAMMAAVAAAVVVGIQWRRRHESPLLAQQRRSEEAWLELQQRSILLIEQAEQGSTHSTDFRSLVRRYHAVMGDCVPGWENGRPITKQVSLLH